MATRRAALALGGGGARGYAHIGVIQVLEERGFEITAVAGSSMGALVGALFAAGKLDDYTNWVVTLTELQVLRLMDVSLTKPGMIRADRVFARMREMLAGQQIETLPVPFTAVATDLFARKAVWFQRGSLETAVRASVAIPGVFTPVMLNGRVLVDGGVVDPVPVAPIASTDADVTIAVDLGGFRGPDDEQAGAPVRETAEPRPVEEWAEAFRRRASNLLDQDLVRNVLARFGRAPRADRIHEADSDDDVEPFPSGLGRFDVMNHAMEVTQTVITRYRLAGYAPDVLITVSRDAARTLDFHRAGELIELGRHLATEALDAHSGP